MYDLSWIPRAVTRWSHWCRQAGFEYRFVARSLTQWSQHAHFPYAWEFGANIKYVAIEEFLKDESLGDRFLWIDPDIYPKDEALRFDWNALPLTTFMTRDLPPSWAGYPGPMDGNNQHALCKLIWTGRQEKSSSIVFDAGLMSMSRETAQSFWDWLNRDHSIHSEEWWAAHAEKQAACTKVLLDIGVSNAVAWMFGTDEMYFEDWVNSTDVQFSRLPEGVHEHYCKGQECDAILVHYNGQNKAAYPFKCHGLPPLGKETEKDSPK